jgi:hypothetical protein
MRLRISLDRRRLFVSGAVLALLVQEPARVFAQPRPPLARRRAAEPAPAPKFSQETRDAFFADALKALGPRAEPPRREHPASPQTAATHDAPPDAAWSQLIAAEIIEDEVKQLAFEVDGHVRSLAHFRSSGYRLARRDLTCLAAMFGLIGEFDQPVRWKEQAPALSVRFGHAGQNCKAGSDATFREASARAQDLRDLVRGGRAADTSNGVSSDWAESIDRAPLMLRMETACQERLGPWLAEPRGLERKREQVLHESQVLAALARLIQREGYEFAADETFQGYAQALEQACQQLRQAADANQPAQAQAALSAIRISCEKCHADFRG